MEKTEILDMFPSGINMRGLKVDPLSIVRIETIGDSASRPCLSCGIRTSNCFGCLMSALAEDGSLHTKQHHTKRARLNICRVGEMNRGILVICEGWAFRFAQLTNGKRQIFSVILPGEIVNPASLFGQTTDSVQAVTDVRYCYLAAADIHKKIREDDTAAKFWAQLIAADRQMSDELLVDLGQRAADGRIAAFILRMMKRLSDNIDPPKQVFQLPLRQQHFADLLGLTPVHVCRILSAFRKEKICDISDGIVRIWDLEALRQIGVST
jgi:CRP/FNR family transcriptional regulator